jgi:hypothetical protein
MKFISSEKLINVILTLRLNFDDMLASSKQTNTFFALCQKSAMSLL